MKFKEPADTTPVTTKAGMGYQLGIVGKITKHLSIDLFYRSLQITGDKTYTVDGLL